MGQVNRRWMMVGAVAATALAFGPSARAEQFVNVLTGGTSGVYYPLGVALAKVYGETIPDVRTSTQATKAAFSITL